MEIKNKLFRFTTSWDDGSVLDVRLAQLLDKYGVKGTFYVPKDFGRLAGKFSEYGRRLSEEEIREISLNHEVGAHSLTHALLDTLPEGEIREEAEGSKIFLENIIGKNVEMFCFPGGAYNDKVLKTVKLAGYIGARTTQKLSFVLPKNPFLMPVSIQCISFPFRKKDASHYYLRRLFDPLKAYGFKIFSSAFIFNLFSWQSFARASLNHAIKNGNYFHLIGHSWELEKYNLWDELESFLKYAQNLGSIEFVTNVDITRLAK